MNALRTLAGSWLLVATAHAAAMVCMLPLDSGGKRIIDAYLTEGGLFLEAEDHRLLHRPDVPDGAGFREILAAGAPIHVWDVFDSSGGPLIHTTAITGESEDRNGIYRYGQMQERLLQLKPGEDVRFHRDRDRSWILTENGIYLVSATQARSLEGLDGDYYNPTMYGSGDRVYLGIQRGPVRGELYRVDAGGLAPVPGWTGEIVSGARDLGDKGFLLWTDHAIYRAGDDGLPVRVAENPAGQAPEDICSTGAGLLVLYTNDAKILREDRLACLTQGVSDDCRADPLGYVLSAHPFPPIGSTLVTSKGVFDLRDDGRLEENVQVTKPSRALSIGSAVAILDSDHLLHWRSANQLKEIRLPEGATFRDWRQRYGRLWLATDHGIFELNPTEEKWHAVPGGVFDGDFNFLPREGRRDGACAAAQPTGDSGAGLPAGPLDLLASGDAALARLHSTSLASAHLETSPDYDDEVTPEEANSLRWRITDFPCEAVPGAVKLEVNGTGPKDRAISPREAERGQAGDYPWFLNLGNDVTENGAYVLNFLLRANDGSEESRSLGSHEFKVNETVRAVFVSTVINLWEGIRRQTTLSKLLILLSTICLSGVVVFFITLQRHRKIQIFISYRRSDTRHWARPLYDELKAYFDRGKLFYDRFSIEIGGNWRPIIKKSLKSSKIVLVLIGPGWATTKNAKGGLRLDDPDDFVRYEVDYALHHGKKVIPLLVDGATMPDKQALPEALASLPEKNAISLDRDDKEYQNSIRNLVLTMLKILG